MTSDEYFDKYRFESDPTLLASIAAALVPLVPAGVDVLAGLELGGVPLAVALSQVSGLPAFFVRKEAKTYGTCQLAEGGELAGRRLLVVEDVVTSGGQVVTSCRGPARPGRGRGAGAVRHRPGSGRPAALAEVGVELRPLYTMAALAAAVA